MRKQIIPKKIHQIWLGPKPAPTKWMETWQKFHPDWEYKLWREQDLFPLYNQKQFDATEDYAGKADILRVEILYREGGVYLDADCECINPLDDSLLTYSLFTCYENETLLPGVISNGIIGCKPSHEIMKSMMEAISHLNSPQLMVPWMFLGPLLFTRIVKYYQVFYGALKILPSYKFLPVHHTGASYKGKGKIYSVHHWFTTKEIAEAKKKKK